MSIVEQNMNGARNENHDRTNGQPSKSDCRIYVSNLPRSCNENDLEAIFKEYGVITSNHIGTRPSTPGQVLSFAVIEFQDKASVHRAITGANGRAIHNKQIKVDVFIEKRGLNGRNLYFRNFMEDHLTEAHLMNLFRRYGTIQSFKLELTANGSYRGFGFVCFEQPDDAKRAIKGLHNYKLRSGAQLYVARHEPKAIRSQKLDRARPVKTESNEDEHSRKSQERFEFYKKVTELADSKTDYRSATPTTDQVYTINSIEELRSGLGIKQEELSDKNSFASADAISEGLQNGLKCNLDNNAIGKSSSEDEPDSIVRLSNIRDSEKGEAKSECNTQSDLSECWIVKKCKKCPGCNISIEKNGGCNNMTCTRCSTKFCWVCSAQLNGIRPYQHFSMIVGSDSCSFLGGQESDAEPEN